MNPSETLKTHLCESAKNGSQSAIFFAQIALFTATIFVWKTRLYAEHDRTGFKTALSYQIIAILVSNSSRLSGLGFIRVTCGYKVNSIANLICLILAIVLEKFYEKSLSSLSFALSVTVLFLILLVIMQPSTDLGLFGFLIGVIGSVAYDLFGLKFQTWIVVAICFPLLGFRFWLDKNWLGEHPNRRPRGRNQVYKSLIIEELTVAGFHLFWVYNLFRINCPQKKGPPKSMSCTSISVMGMLAYVFIFNLWFGHVLLSRVYSLFQTESQPQPQHKPEPQPQPQSGQPRMIMMRQPQPGQPRMIMMRQPQPGQPGLMIMMRQRPLSMSSAQEGKEARPPLIMSSAQPLIMSSGQPLIMSSAQGGTCVYSLFQTEPELEQEAIAHKKED